MDFVTFAKASTHESLYAKPFQEPARGEALALVGADLERTFTKGARHY